MQIHNVAIVTALSFAFVDSPHSSAAAQAPAPAVTESVTTRLSSGASTYRVGEAIPLELEFRGTGDHDYYFSTATCGDFGHAISPERVTISPSDGGVEDPLGDLYSVGRVGSCLSSSHPLDGRPLVIRAVLNDAVRFTRAGGYSIVVSSTRLQRYSRAQAPTLASEPITVTIVPSDAAWTDAEVSRSVRLIDAGTAADVRQGAALLRYLGTDTAARALVDRYDAVSKVDAYGLHAGLLSSPQRALVISLMEARLDAGGTIDERFYRH